MNSSLSFDCLLTSNADLCWPLGGSIKHTLLDLLHLHAVGLFVDTEHVQDLLKDLRLVSLSDLHAVLQDHDDVLGPVLSPMFRALLCSSWEAQMSRSNKACLEWKTLHTSNIKNNKKYVFWKPYSAGSLHLVNPGTSRDIWRHTQSSACPAGRYPKAALRIRSSRWGWWQSTPQSCGGWWRKWGRWEPAGSFYKRDFSAEETEICWDMRVLGS